MTGRTFCPAFSPGSGSCTATESLPPWSYIRLRDSNLKFYIEGRFVGRYDRRRQLRRIVFLFRNTEEEITRKFILGMALSQTKIFPWFFDLGHNRMVIDERWFAHLGLPAATARSAPKISSGSCIPKTEAGWPTPSQNNSQES